MPFKIGSAALIAAIDEAENLALRKEIQEADTYVVKTTEELVETLKKSTACVEASLVLGALRATHFLNYEEGVLYDMGIDSEEIETDLEEFAARYPKGRWMLWINNDEIAEQLLGAQPSNSV